MQERDKIRQWVHQSYCQRHPQDFQSRGSTSEEDGELEKEGYREMLKENMALSEYECWSEKWDTCPYFIRTGKRCRKGKGCEGCDSLRVSDSDYESVCGVPRHLPFQPFSPLSRDKSRSMPLHWHKVPSMNSSPSSLAGSCLSLHASSRTESIQSLDSLDGNDPFDSPGGQTANVVLKELRSIEGKLLSSPSGSRIPILGRKEGRYSGKGGETRSPSVNRVLDFVEVRNGGDEMDEEDGDVLTELRDEFMPLHREVSIFILVWASQVKWITLIILIWCSSPLGNLGSWLSCGCHFVIWTTLPDGSGKDSRGGHDKELKRSQSDQASFLRTYLIHGGPSNRSGMAVTHREVRPPWFGHGHACLMDARSEWYLGNSEAGALFLGHIVLLGEATVIEGVVGLQHCLSGWCVESSLRINTRAEHCIVRKLSMLFTSPVSGSNVVADGCMYCMNVITLTTCRVLVNIDTVCCKR